MIEQLRVDYRAMQGMIFGDPPDFEAVLDSIGSLETTAARKDDVQAQNYRASAFADTEINAQGIPLDLALNVLAAVILRGVPAAK